MNSKEESCQFSQIALSVQNILSGSFVGTPRSPSRGPRAASKPRFIAIQRALLNSEAANIADLRHLSTHASDPKPSPSPTSAEEVYEDPSFRVFLTLDEDVDSEIFLLLIFSSLPGNIQFSTFFISGNIFKPHCL
jgi:hypothetical protein